MMRIGLQFLCGLLFGVGLVWAGMSNPAKVLNFLDLGGIAQGTWDGSLLFVLAGAIAVAFAGFGLVFRRAKPFFADRFILPVTTSLDARLLTGAAIFGIGWGLAGLCPGPAFTTLAGLSLKAFIFMAAMLGGMALARLLSRN